MDLARALNVFTTELYDILVTRREVTDVDEHSGVGVRVPRFAGLVVNILPPFNQFVLPVMSVLSVFYILVGAIETRWTLWFIFNWTSPCILVVLKCFKLKFV